MSRKGIRLYPYVKEGGRYKLGQDLVPIVVATSSGPSSPIFQSSDWAIWGLAGVWSTMPQTQATHGFASSDWAVWGLAGVWSTMPQSQSTVAPAWNGGAIWGLASVWSTGNH